RLINVSHRSQSVTKEAFMVNEELLEKVVEEPIAEKRQTHVPVGFVPTPTVEYRERRKLAKAVTAVGAPPAPTPLPVPIPVLSGPRVLLWKQDPSVGEIGIRKAFLPRPASSGPSDARINVAIAGMPPVTANAFGDFIETPL